MNALPNYLSALRIVLVIPIAWLLWQQQVMSAFWLMLFAGLSDALDGFLARRYGWQTELGSLLDPLADKFLVAAMYLVFTLHELIPVWLVALILTRDILILLGAGVYRGVFGDLTVNPSLLSKTNTAVQISIVLLLMVSQMPIGELGGELLTVLGDVGYPPGRLVYCLGRALPVLWGWHSWRRLRVNRREQVLIQVMSRVKKRGVSGLLSGQAVLPIDAPHQLRMANFVVGSNRELCDALVSFPKGFLGSGCAAKMFVAKLICCRPAVWLRRKPGICRPIWMSLCLDPSGLRRWQTI